MSKNNRKFLSVTARTSTLYTLILTRHTNIMFGHTYIRFGHAYIALDMFTLFWEFGYTFRNVTYSVCSI